MKLDSLDGFINKLNNNVAKKYHKYDAASEIWWVCVEHSGNALYQLFRSLEKSFNFVIYPIDGNEFYIIKPGLDMPMAGNLHPTIRKRIKKDFKIILQEIG